jgi:hypothetical protein
MHADFYLFLQRFFLMFLMFKENSVILLNTAYFTPLFSSLDK